MLGDRGGQEVACQLDRAEPARPGLEAGDLGLILGEAGHLAEGVGPDGPAGPDNPVEEGRRLSSSTKNRSNNSSKLLKDNDG